MHSIEERRGILGTEIGQMMAYISEVKERAFENTSGLPESSASQPMRLGPVNAYTAVVENMWRWKSQCMQQC
jgi:hypothetical protein